MIARCVVVMLAALTVTTPACATAAAPPSGAAAIRIDQAEIDGAFVTLAFTYSCPARWADAEKRDARVAAVVSQGGVRASTQTRDLWCDGEPHQVYTPPFGGSGWRRLRPGAADAQAQLFRGADMLRVPDAETTCTVSLD